VNEPAVLLLIWKVHVAVLPLLLIVGASQVLFWIDRPPETLGVNDVKESAVPAGLAVLVTVNV
jgi:hypothetical protein